MASGVKFSWGNETVWGISGENVEWQVAALRFPPSSRKVETSSVNFREVQTSSVNFRALNNNSNHSL